MFFPFQLALPKTSVLLLCQHNSRFLTFFILFFALCPFPLLLGHFALCPLEVYSFFYSMLFHSLSFWGSTRSFSMPVCFNSDFLTFFILLFPFAFCRLLFWHIALCSLEVYSFFLFYVVSFAVFLWQYSLFFNVCLFQQSFSYLFYIVFALCPFPFAFGTFRPLPFEILPVVFLFSVVSFAVFLGRSSLFFNVCLFQQRFSYLFYIVFCPLLLSFAFGTFRPLPFSILQTAFCPLLPPFVVFFLFCVWNSPFALLLTAICCKNLLLDKKFSKNKKSLEIVIKTFDNT